jgi:hypothetical protein
VLSRLPDGVRRLSAFEIASPFLGGLLFFFVELTDLWARWYIFLPAFLHAYLVFKLVKAVSFRYSIPFESEVETFILAYFLPNLVLARLDRHTARAQGYVFSRAINDRN